MDREAPARPIVVCVCGMLASGKSTLVRELASHLRTSSVLEFDEYSEFTRWPADLPKWIEEGANPERVTNPRLRDDLESLVGGRSVLHPLTHERIPPSPFILLEDPFGRAAPDNRHLIDLVLFIDLPADLSVVRLVRRTLGFDRPGSPEELAEVSDTVARERIEALHQWLEHYQTHRPMYVSSKILAPVRDSADVILDGTKEAEAVCDEALAAIRQAFSSATSSSGR